MRIGIFFCQIDNGLKINIDSVAKYAANLQEVEIVQILGVKPRINIDQLAETIKVTS
jgi:hypothetical protein